MPLARCWALVASGLLFVSSVGASVVVDATTPPVPARPLAFAAGGTSKDGHVLAVNDRYFTRDGQPWFPVMGEFHYARYPAAEWDTELEKMKAGGVDIVATYVFWIVHEEQPGRFDWSGQRDLRRFVAACGRHGLGVWLRVGPWDHGEMRNGGFPDWLVAAGPTRENAPGYLEHVRTFFNAIGEQVRGEFWQDGGPIVGVQLENEYHPAKDGEAHMTKLLELARAAGLDAPFYTATGWDHAVMPAQPFLPVFGGYTEQFWSDSRTLLPPNQNFFFTTIRAEDNVGYLLEPKDRAYHARSAGYPFLTAEMGGGMAIAYHRRPVMHAADSTAAALVKLGSGITLLGYYMYHGGTNPDAAGPLEESFTGWNAYNDLETKSYDFQAPLGEFGQERETYRTTRALHLFLHDFGAQLAPMAAYFPAESPRSLDDMITPRVAVRSDSRGAFVFLNNYERNYALPAKTDFQVTVKLPGGDVTLPRTPTALPSGVYTHWTVNLPVASGMVRSATAQLLGRLADPDTVVFGATDGIPAEFVVVPAAGATVTAEGARVRKAGDAVIVDEIVPGRNAALKLRGTDGRETAIVLLSHDDALHLSKTTVGGRERLVLTSAATWATGAGLELEAETPEQLTLSLFPALANPPANFRAVGTAGLFAVYASTTPAAPHELAAVRLVKPAGPARAVPLNADPKRRVATEPTDADFADAAVWTIALPADVVAGQDHRLLRLRYEGDVARLYAGERLLTDNFYRGTPFEFGLWRLSAQERAAGLTLKVLPLRRDAPVYLPRDAWPDFHGQESVVDLCPPELVPLYRVTFAP